VAAGVGGGRGRSGLLLGAASIAGFFSLQIIRKMKDSPSEQKKEQSIKHKNKLKKHKHKQTIKYELMINSKLR
jgi:hypothetical protein